MRLRVWVNGITSSNIIETPEEAAPQVALAHRMGSTWDVRHEKGCRYLTEKQQARLIAAVRAELTQEEDSCT